MADDPALIELAADYLGQLAAALVMTWSPHRIVWGGGVIMGAPIIPLIHEKMLSSLAGYGTGSAAQQPGFCAPAALKDAGLEGAVLMARELTQPTK